MHFLSSANRVLVLVPTVLALALGASQSGCSAGSDSGATGTDSGSGGSTGTGFTTGTGGSTGSGPVCTAANCIGSTPQGMCDGSLAIDSSDAMDGARAIGLCQVATDGTWGVVNAEWVRSDGQPLTGESAIGKGILDGFGMNVAPREGSQLLALSSGAARDETDAGYESVSGYWKDCGLSDPFCFNGPPTPHGTPAGYPKTSASCSVQAGEAYDSAGLRLTIRTPADAKSFSFALKFYTYEFPDYVCDIYNDFFVSMMTPTPAGLPDGNISFDSMGNTISVNAGFLDVCNAQTASNGQAFACSAGYSEMVGTGFDEQDPGSGATTWLQTTAPIDAPGEEITLHFTIWDSGDGVLDSTILIDEFKFELTEGVVGTTPIPQ